MAINKDHPNLKHFKGSSVKEIEEQLKKAHQYLVSKESGMLGYLYQQQIIRVRDKKQ